MGTILTRTTTYIFRSMVLFLVACDSTPIIHSTNTHTHTHTHIYTYLCFGIHVLCTDWFIKRPSKVAISQVQSNQKLTIYPWRLRILCHRWVWVLFKIGTHKCLNSTEFLLHMQSCIDIQFGWKSDCMNMGLKIEV